MRENTAIPAELRVTVQVRSETLRPVGYVASGILADSDVVLVPNPPTLDTDQELEVLIFPIPVETYVLVERMEIRKNVAHGLTGSMEQPTFAYLKLGQHSRYRAQVADFDDHALGQALEDLNGDFTAAMTQIGAIGEGILKVDDDLLEQVTRAELAQHRPRTDIIDHASYDELARGLCKRICRCIPPHSH